MGRAKALAVLLAQPALDQAPELSRGKLGLRPSPLSAWWPAPPLTRLTLCVAEDTYSSEETVDQQPVHLRVMDTADLVTLPPLQLRAQPPEKSWPTVGASDGNIPFQLICCVTLSWPKSLHLPNKKERGGARGDLMTEGISSKILCSGA